MAIKRLVHVVANSLLSVAFMVSNFSAQIFEFVLYPARELPIPGVTSALIREKMKNGNVKEVEKDTITEEINRIYEMQERLLLITAGAGGIDAVVEPIKKQLTLSKNEHQ